MALKHDLLEFFIEKQNNIISGQELATDFNVTRSAIWKAIEELRESGYVIESVPRKGYRYTRSSPKLDSQQLSLRLNEDWQDVIIQIYDEVTSTNDVAKIFAANRPKEKGYVISHQQSKGRGRYGKSFHSMLEHGLYSSVIMPITHAKMEHIPLITIATAAAMTQAIERICGKQLDIKWVNDLFYKGRKVSGILCEAISDLESGQITSVIIGVGLNLAGNFEDTDDNVKSVAGTIFGQELPLSLNLNELLAEYLNLLSTYVKNIEKKEFLTFYNDRLLGLNQEVTYQSKGVKNHGIIRGINDSGHLLVEVADGEIEALYGQEIHLSSQQFAKDPHN